MCGIAGFIDYSKTSTYENLKNMTDALHHRGPDDSGYELFTKKKNVIVGMGHKRLSILDLSISGHQPMFDDNRKYIIIFNGEIYNFTSIRKELIKLGFNFNSTSDTEVILKGYICWGENVVNKLIGMFSFIIYDIDTNVLKLFRDRTGVKPLYFYANSEIFLFASELKSFHKHPLFKKEINLSALNIFLNKGYIPSPMSIFRNCEKVKPGYIISIDIGSKSVEYKEYWNVFDYYKTQPLNINEDNAILEMERIFKSSFNYRMIADVPIGVFLSGGYDSSLVSAMLQTNMTNKLKTFTIGFHENKFNEAPYAKEIANFLGTDHTEYICTYKDALEIIPQLPVIFDEPMSDSSAIPTILLSTIARNDVTVALSSDGSDEIFAGYNIYPIAASIHNTFKKYPIFIRNLLWKLFNIFDPDTLDSIIGIYNFSTRYGKITNMLLSKNIQEAYDIITSGFSRKQMEKLCKTNRNQDIINNPFYYNLNLNTDAITTMQAIDYTSYLEGDILAKVDRASMSVSLESRDPFLDHRIIEFAAQLPSNFKYKNGIKKYMLKKIAHKYIPKEMLDRPKMGFGIPIGEWLRKDLKEYVEQYLSHNKLKRHNLFNLKYIEFLKHNFFAGKHIDKVKIWRLLIFQMWYEKWM